MANFYNLDNFQFCSSCWCSLFVKN